MIEVLLVDDQASVRRGVRMRLELEPDIEVVGEAGDGEEALSLIGSLTPGVVLMDISMPGMGGMLATGALRAVAPAANVVILSLRDDPTTRGWAAAAGAFAFVGKHEPCDALVATIRRAAADLGHDGKPAVVQRPLQLGPPDAGRSAR